MNWIELIWLGYGVFLWMVDDLVLMWCWIMLVFRIGGGFGGWRFCLVCCFVLLLYFKKELRWLCILMKWCLMYWDECSIVRYCGYVVWVCLSIFVCLGWWIWLGRRLLFLYWVFMYWLILLYWLIVVELNFCVLSVMRNYCFGLIVVWMIMYWVKWVLWWFLKVVCSGFLFCFVYCCGRLVM